MKTEQRDIWVPVSVISATNPSRLTKGFSLHNGKVAKLDGGLLIEGQAICYEVRGLLGFSDLIASLQPNQALAYGVTEQNEVKLTTKNIWNSMGCPNGVIPRTHEFFKWNDGLGIMMLDYDPEPGTEPLRAEELISKLREIVPGLKNAQLLWIPSASSFIFNSETNEEVYGLRGQRIYVIVKDATDIPRAGNAIMTALWAAGHGYMKINKSGALLERALIDGLVWQSNRLDFAAGAECDPPLLQKRGSPRIWEGSNEVIDTRKVFPEPSTRQVNAANRNRDAARSACREKALDIRQKWMTQRAQKLVGTNATENKLQDALKTLELAANTGVLNGEFILNIIEDGEVRQVSVSNLLSQKDRYDQALALDPLEPEYKGGRPVAKLFLNGARPILHSFAHGPKTYQLAITSHQIEVVEGQTHAATNHALEFLSEQSDVFSLGKSPVLVGEGKVLPQDKASLAHLLGSRLQFFKWKLTRSDAKRIYIDPPPKVLEQVLSTGTVNRLKPLKAVISAPTITSDGTIITSPGYNSDTGLYLDGSNNAVFESVPMNPTHEEVQKALEGILFPFRDFPFVGAMDRGVFLAALLTALARPSLEKAPAFGFDAPVQGSGKSLLASAVSALCTGEEPIVSPHVRTRDDDEIRKRLFAALLHGSRAIVWDNVIGSFDSAALSAFLSSSSYSDRVLGKSETIAVPNRALLIFTGNNLTFSGDLARRVLKCRIDPQMGNPFAREFDLDPVQYVLKHRQAIVADGLTLISAYLKSGACRGSGRMASFEQWDDLIRQTVVWIGRNIGVGKFEDPMQAVVAAQDDDPERAVLSEVLELLDGIFEGNEFTASEVVAETNKYGAISSSTSSTARLADVLREWGERVPVSSRSLGKALCYRVGRIVGGRKLEAYTDRHAKTKVFRIVNGKP